MPSKLVIDRERAARAVGSSAAVHAEAAAAGLARWLEVYLLPGERLPDVELLFRLLERALAEQCERLVRADETAVTERIDDFDPRRRRAAAAAEVRRRLVDLRRLLKGFYGHRQGSALLRMRGRIPEDPLALRAQAARTLAALRETVDWPPVDPRLPPVTWQPHAIADVLEPPLATLGEALDEVVRDRTSAAGTHAAKAAAMAAFDETLRRAARLLEAHLDAAGMTLAAERVRRKRSRRGRRAVAGEVPA